MKLISQSIPKFRNRFHSGVGQQLATVRPDIAVDDQTPVAAEHLGAGTG
jgi:hypothetical protein